jgi:hypothetical protein
MIASEGVPPPTGITTGGVVPALETPQGERLGMRATAFCYVGHQCGQKRCQQKDGNVCFSNWPCWVKHFQSVHFIGLNVSHGVSLLSGIGTCGPSIMGFEEEAEQSFGRPCCPIRTAGPSRHTNSPHPSSREGHRSTAWWNSLSLLPCCSMKCGSHAAASCRVHWNSVPSTQMRCMTTASLRASATIAFFKPRVLAIFIAHALSQDHFVVRTSTIWAAS